MACRTHILVVASRTVNAPALMSELKGRAGAGPITVTLLVPARLEERDGARERMREAVAELRMAGLDAEGRLGPADPISAVAEEYDNSRYDEVIVSTLAESQSRWLAQGLPARVERMTGAVVRQVSCPEDALVASAPRSPRGEPLLEGMLRQLHVDTNDIGHPYG